MDKVLVQVAVLIAVVLIVLVLFPFDDGRKNR